MIFRFFIILLLVLGIPLSALADLTLGVVLQENAPIQTEPQAIRMAYALKKQLDEKVKVRIFTDEATLHVWLNRYQLVDIAIFTRTYVKRQAPGEFLPLRGTESFIPQGILVLRQGIPQQTARKIQAAVPALADDLKSMPLPAKTPTETKVAKDVKSKPAAKARPRIRPVREEPAPAPAQLTKPAGLVEKSETSKSPPASNAASLSPSSSKAAEKTVESNTAVDQEAQQAETVASSSNLAESGAKRAEEQTPEVAGSVEQGAQPQKPTVAKSSKDQDRVFLIWIAAVLVILLVVLLFWRRKSDSTGSLKEASANTTPPSIISAALNKVGQPKAPTEEKNDEMDFEFGEAEKPSARKSASIISSAMDKIYDKQPKSQTTVDSADTEFDFVAIAEAQAPVEMIDSVLETDAEKADASLSSEAAAASENEFFAVADDDNPVEEPAEPDEVLESEPPFTPAPELSGTMEAVEGEADFFTPINSEMPETFGRETAVTERTDASIAEEPVNAWLTSEKSCLEPTAGEEKNLIDPDEEDNSLDDGSLLSVDYEEVLAGNETMPGEPFVAEPDQTSPDLSEQVDEEAPMGQTPEWMDSNELTPFSEVGLPPLEDRNERAIEVATDEHFSIPEGSEESLVSDREEGSSAADDHGLVDGLAGPTDEPDVVDLMSDRMAETEEASAVELTIPESEQYSFSASGLTTVSSFFDERDFPPPMEKDESEKIDVDRDVSTASEVAVETSPVTSTTTEEQPKTRKRPSIPLRISGELGPSQLPALLKLIAGQNKTGTLAVQSRLVEKRIYFRQGKIAGASSNNLVKGTGSRFLMLKLGELLVRKGRITEEERDHALKICSLQPSRRIGEVLLETCGLTQAELKSTLRLQTEEIIFSLFLFPGGKFEYMTSKIPIPVDDDLAIDVNGLLRDAARQTDEWRELRKMIPSLNTVMEIKEDSYKKLHNARLAPQQDMILSLVDGNRTIYEICRLTGVLEFEVYKFLYLMGKARIVSPVNPDSTSSTI